MCTMMLQVCCMATPMEQQETGQLHSFIVASLQASSLAEPKIVAFGRPRWTSAQSQAEDQLKDAACNA